MIGQTFVKITNLFKRCFALPLPADLDVEDVHPIRSTKQDHAGDNGTVFQPFGASFPPWKANTDVAWNYRKLATDLYSQHTGPDSNFAAGAIGVTGYRPGAASYCQFNLTVAYTCHSSVRS